MNRISFEDMAMNIAKVVKERSEDLHKKVGVCILDNHGRVLSVGYNGIKPKVEKNDSFWLDRDNRRKYVIHAEANALSSITRSSNPFILASTLLPCASCAINICSYGIKKVLYIEDYANDQSAYDILKFHEVELIKYESNC
jgi:dCMP deaminase